MYQTCLDRTMWKKNQLYQCTQFQMSESEL